MAVFHSIADLLLHERKRMAGVKGTVEHRFDTMVEFSREDHLILTSGTIPKKLIERSFNDIESKTAMIKAEIFPKNTKACYAFGKPCPYFSVCRYNNFNGLHKK
jgi:hypothetical protein